MKYICLSFDDGPCNSSPDTMSEMLDILEENKVTASFFVIGNKITEQNKAVLKRALNLGCDLQNHSFTHPDMSKLTKEQITEEYEKTEKLIVELSGKRSTFFRPPYILTNDLMYDTIKVPFICGVGCNDWDNNYDDQYRIKEMKNTAKDGVIYLLHVMEGNDYTLKACKEMIPYLKEQGYIFVTVPEMFALKNINTNQKGKLWSIAE